ncbi:MAG: DUF1456 family protein [bacterium]|nr:DUF1456 family protein [bacterium]
MLNNDIIRRLRYALNINDSTMIEIFKEGDFTIEPSALTDLLKKEDDEGYAPCNDAAMASFLNGLIIHKRGRKEPKPGQQVQRETQLTNNDILKKLRIALDLKEEDMLGILKLAEVTISKSELSALFRKKGHKHYRECGDQFLRNFLQGLTQRNRA